MIKKGRHLITSHMTLEYDFSGIRINQGAIIPVDWKLTVDLVAEVLKGKTQEEVEYIAGVAYQKIYFWLETNLPNIGLVDVTSEVDMHIANLSTNIIMFCPDIPSDDTFIQLLHAKISTLANNVLIVSEMTLKGTDTALKYTYDVPLSGYALPVNTSEYYVGNITRNETPWWLRDDGFCFEFAVPADSKIPTEDLFTDIVDPMDEFYKMMEEMKDATITMTTEPARIVKIEKWTPKKVD